MTDTKLIPNRVIVDRTVLVELLDIARLEAADDVNESRWWMLDQLAGEIESGQRVELYAKDWPGGDAS